MQKGRLVRVRAACSSGAVWGVLHAHHEFPSDLAARGWVPQGHVLHSPKTKSTCSSLSQMAFRDNWLLFSSLAFCVTEVQS